MNWSECNAVLAQRLRRNGDALVGPITSADRDLYRQFFAADNRIACYGNSWTYITQACRGFGLGLKYYDGDTLCSIGCHRGHYVVVRPLGVVDEHITNLLEALQSASGKPVFIKKLFPEQAAALFHLADFKKAVRRTSSVAPPEPGDYPWDSSAYADDDTYPEMILDTSISCNPVALFPEWWTNLQRTWLPPADRHVMGSVRYDQQKFRQKIHKFLRDVTTCRVTGYQIEKATAVRDFLLSYFGPDRSQDVDAYENMLADDGQDEVFGFVAYLNDDPAPKAFFFAERLDQQSAGLYAGIASRADRGLIQYMYAHMVSVLQKAGIILLNLGGSECRGLHRFKERLVPVQERQMQMLVYDAS